MEALEYSNASIEEANLRQTNVGMVALLQVLGLLSRCHRLNCA